ncbi:MAG: peroxidase family protein [Pseudomonadota bacterium]
MAKSLKNRHHGMVSGVQTAIKWACHDMEKGTETLGHLPKVEVGEGHMGLEAREALAQRTFGRLYDAVPVSGQPSEDAIRKLAASMEEAEGDEKDGPAAAGSAFFGQFIDHDLTLDATTMLGKASGAVTRIENFRTPRFDLDSVYGSGPEVTPWLYGQNGRRFGLAVGSGAEVGLEANDLDLQRNKNRRALIGDPRNDENLFISQVHGRQFVIRHNALLEAHGDSDEGFEAAREELQAEYVQRVLHEFLPDVVDPDVLNPLKEGYAQGKLPEDRVRWSCAPDMPVEFSAAAFRFGHSMIRQTYALNDRFPEEEIFSEVNRGFKPVAPWHNLEMDRFFGDSAQRARPINTRIVPDLIRLPAAVVGSMPNLAERNMLRGQRTFCLPSGERVAEAMGVDVLPAHPQVQACGLEGNTPLWFYILWEAENTGGRLGAVGGTLVAGTILNLLLRGGAASVEGEAVAAAITDREAVPA